MSPERKASLSAEALEQLSSLLAQVKRAAEGDSPSGRVKQLRDCYALMNRSVDLKPGDIVRWKPGLKNRKLPHYDEPVIVVEVCPEPKPDETSDSGSTYFREPLSVVLGILGPEDENFLLFYYDARRFELYQETSDSTSPHN